jgi:hypothetical protein
MRLGLYQRVIAAIAGALIVACATNARAFDGHRKGFVLGGGIGGGAASLKQEDYIYITQERNLKEETTGTFVTDFRIGAAHNDQWMLYYDNQVWWGSAEFISGKEAFALGIGLIGISYYLTADVPSWYVLGTAGVSFFGPSDNYTAQTGFGLSGGAGYEFARHWSLEAVVGWGNPDSNSGDWKTDALVLAVRVVGLAY